MRTRLQAKISRRAFTLVEVLVSLALTGMMVTGIVSGFVQSAKQAEWSAYSLAAQSQALQKMEQVRAAQWDPLHFPPVDEVQQANFATVVDILDIPTAGNNITYITNRTFITPITTTPPLRMITVESSWRFLNRGVFTNSIRTYRTVDQ
jgi:prepilin-type N-terminal cleavage/methylation domain-containing protein